MSSTGAAAVIGAGGWGTALACVLGMCGHKVNLWARRAELAQHVQETRCNEVYLPGVTLPASLRCTADPEEALSGAELVVFSTPAQAMGQVSAKVGRYVSPSAAVVSSSKGLEIATLRRMSQVLAESLGRPEDGGVAALSGPNFAAEVARGLPAATVVASADEELNRGIRSWFASSRALRVYTRRDIVGVELGGALKNVIALVAGLVDGMELGLNARAAVITRGLAEITRLGVAMGADALTFAGLSGMGDLVLTCTGQLSRNLWAGRELGKGRSLADILAGTPMVVEGVGTTRAAQLLAAELGVEMPLTQQMHEVLFDGKPASEALSAVLRRSLRDEREFS
ncbi:MAG: NAD(P)H-dependent glycerol-3-phosphate dehydrogenase [Bacillota bacterium]|nr:NAD(P)H-dependent glycerol-3-phosphate dehydrogenase [Bacillota bacterium]